MITKSTWRKSSAHATELWRYFQAVINWVENTFPVYRKEMKGLEWGLLYNKYKDENLDPKQLESRIKSLMEDEEVTKRSGIYEYVLSNEERFLNLRAFNDKEKRILYERQQGICHSCTKQFDYDDMQGDHIIPWSKGGKTSLENGQMLCRKCNATKSAK